MTRIISLPVRTYRPKGDNVVYIEIQAEGLIIRASPQGDLLARHPLCHEKGRLIKNQQHTKARSKGIQVDKKILIHQFQDQDNATQFIRELGLRYPRYIRHQLYVMQHALSHFHSEIEKALTICI